MISGIGEHILVKFDKCITKKICQPVPILIKIGLPGCISPSGFPTDDFNEFLISPMHATCLTYYILIYLATQIRRRVLDATSIVMVV
jgi:hypothetical protein